jgi:hypothetical protein
MSGPDSLPIPDSQEFTIEDSVKEYLTPAGKDFYENHKQEIKQLFNESLTNDDTKNKLIEKLKIIISGEDNSMFFQRKKIVELNLDHMIEKLNQKIEYNKNTIFDGGGPTVEEVAQGVAYIAVMFLYTYALANNYIFAGSNAAGVGGSKHKKRKGRKSKKTKKSMKHKKGRKSKKAKKSMKKKKGRKKKKSMKKRR